MELESLIILLLIFGVIIRFFAANAFHDIAILEGFPSLKYFWWSFLFGIIGYLLVIALPDKNQQKIHETMMESNEKSKNMVEIEDDELPDL